jgi:hypothetical protein
MLLDGAGRVKGGQAKNVAGPIMLLQRYLNTISNQTHLRLHRECAHHLLVLQLRHGHLNLIFGKRSHILMKWMPRIVDVYVARRTGSLTEIRGIELFVLDCLLYLTDHLDCNFYDLPSPNRFFAQTWPHLKKSAGEIIKHKFTRNKTTCKYWVLCTDNPTNFHCTRLLTIPSKFRQSNELTTTLSSPLIQISSLRRNNNVFTSVIWKRLIPISCYKINRLPSNAWNSAMIIILGIPNQAPGYPGPTHQTTNSFYITLRRQENPALRQSYASELHQVVLLHLSRAGLTSCY